MELVSIILPCYNAEDYLKEAIESIIKQTYKNIELILINDGSSDSSSSICKKYNDIDGRISYYENTKNEGLISTLNKGINYAQGEYIARMDADDISHPQRIERQLSYLKKHPDIDVLGTKAASTWKDKKSMPFLFCEPNTLSVSSYFVQPFFHGSVMAKASVFKTHEYSKDFPHSEDFELWLRLNDLGYNLANLNEVLYIYRKNEVGVSQSNEKAQTESHSKASRKYLEKLMKADIAQTQVDIINGRPKQTINSSQYAQSILVWENFWKTVKVENSAELKRFKSVQLFNIKLQGIKKSSSILLSLKLLCSLLYCKNFYKKLFN